MSLLLLCPFTVQRELVRLHVFPHGMHFRAAVRRQQRGDSLGLPPSFILALRKVEAVMIAMVEWWGWRWSTHATPGRRGRNPTLCY